MRKLLVLLLLAPSALVYACGGDDSGNDGGTDAQADNTTKDSGGADTSTDTGPQDSGTDVTDSSTSDVTITLQCQRPGDCFDGGQLDAAYPPDSGEVCCATAVTTGTQPNCSLASLTTACKAPGSCASNIPLSLNCGTDTIRGCAHAAECTDGDERFTTTTSVARSRSGEAGGAVLCKQHHRRDSGRREVPRRRPVIFVCG